MIKRAIYIGETISDNDIFLNYGMTGNIVSSLTGFRPKSNQRFFQPDGFNKIVVLLNNDLYQTEA